MGCRGFGGLAPTEGVYIAQENARDGPKCPSQSATWLGGEHSSLLAANFGMPQGAIDKLPKKGAASPGES